jgi:hypothetical protein
MFRWYRNATKCYAYLSDVSTKKRKASSTRSEYTWEPAFRSSYWFKRGWTFQELLALSTVEFFSEEWKMLGNKVSLKLIIREITNIPHEALDGTPLSKFSVNERLQWTEGRVTTHEEDGAYSLQGILDVDLAPVYREAAVRAYRRLHDEIHKLQGCIQDIRHTDPRDDKKRIEETKGGLLAESYRWILDNTSFQRWRQDPHSPLLWVKGDPGKGKTMLLCVTAQARRKTIRMWCESTQRHMGVCGDSVTLDLCLSTPIGLVRKDIKKLVHYLESRRD